MLFLGLTVVMIEFVTCRIVEKEYINLQAFLIGVLYTLIGSYGLLTSYILSGMVLLIVMSAFACAGLRPSQSQHTLIGTYGLLTSYILSGMVLLIVMSAFACAGLRPSQSQQCLLGNSLNACPSTGEAAADWLMKEAVEGEERHDLETLRGEERRGEERGGERGEERKEERGERQRREGRGERGG
ncbi:UNVERIFIED_CONTAM: hypothetical protein FKN15_020418 [Acipenser sinensis]